MPVKKIMFEQQPPGPTFKPTLKEFDDPIGYIDKIRPIAQNYGICKILSPKSWNPPFTVDQNQFKFYPKFQRLSDLGCGLKVKHNFILSLESYWNNQNTAIDIPVFSGVPIDLFKLYSTVCQYGGLHQVNKNKQWTILCHELGFGDTFQIVSAKLKCFYEKIIQPYLEFCDKKFREANESLFIEDESPNKNSSGIESTCESLTNVSLRKRYIKKHVPSSCSVCQSIESTNTMVQCVDCDLKFHSQCLNPKLSSTVRPWTCHRCTKIRCARELSCINGSGQSEYSLESFATFADTFKRTYFNNRENVSITEVEEEYWRLISAEDGNVDVVVKCGNEISAGRAGRGFPSKETRHLLSNDDQMYVDHGWNLNNLSGMDKSLLRLVSTDVSAMTVPRCTVGMVFSSSSWHTEEHWSYSVNYMHTGECKTWYGVPETDADRFEELMRSQHGPLLANSSHPIDITTQIDPSTLTAGNVHVYRIDQAPGEFVVTFPRAYHASFDHGFNFSESVNLCTADWLSRGRTAMERYRVANRPSLFAHDELVCAMVRRVDSLDRDSLEALYDELVALETRENAVSRCAMSAEEVSSMVAKVKCRLEESRAWTERIVQVTEHKAKDKPSIEELKMLLHIGRKMNCPSSSLEFLDSIIVTCQGAMAMTNQLLMARKEEDKENDEGRGISRYEDQRDRLTLTEMRMLTTKLCNLPARIPQTEEMAEILCAVDEWRQKVRQVVTTAQVTEESSLAELLESVRRVAPVYLGETAMVRKMRVYARWVGSVRGVIDGVDRSHLATLSQLRALREDGLSLMGTIEIDRMATLAEDVDGAELGSADTCDDATDHRRVGWNIVAKTVRSYERQLTKDIFDGELMEKEAENILKIIPGRLPLNDLKTLLRSAERRLNCAVAGIERLKEVLKEATLVNVKVTEMWQKLQQCRRLVHIDDMEALLVHADSLCVSLTHLADLKSLHDSVQCWRSNLANIFVKTAPNPPLATPTLLEVLFPRPSRIFKLMIARESVSSKLVAACKAEAADGTGIKRTKKRADDPQVASKDNVAVFESFLKSGAAADVDSFNGQYRNMCQSEMEWMWNLRELNEDKARRDSAGHETYCFCRGRAQRGGQVMCDLCQDWCHAACLAVRSEDLREEKFLCPQCRRSQRPPFEVMLAEKRKMELEAKMLRIPEHAALCLMSQRVISFHKHTNQLFSPQTELGAVFAEYKRLCGVQAILPRSQVDQPLLPSTDAVATTRQTRKTAHGVTSPVLSQATMRSLQKLKLSLSDDARRELEEIYIELCLLEVDQTTVTWIWRLYHSLLDDDGHGEDGESLAAAEAEVKTGTERDSPEHHHSPHYDQSPPQTNRKADTRSHTHKYIKQEPIISPDDRMEPLQKFSFKRKLVAKSTAKSPIQIKKQFKIKSPTIVVPKKRGRRSKKDIEMEQKTTLEEGIVELLSQYSDEDDVISLDNVDIDTRRRSTQRPRSKYVAGTNHVTEEPRKRRRRSEDERSVMIQPPEVIIPAKRGRKPSAIAARVNDALSTTTTSKRRHKNAKRVLEDDCAADKCVQQSCEKVNWIACDVCNLWYHWQCVGIRRQAEIGAQFVCERCRTEVTAAGTSRQTGVTCFRDDARSLCADGDDLGTDEFNVSVEDEEHDRDVTVDNGSVSPPFLEAEFGVEETVEISYVSQSDTD